MSGPLAGVKILDLTSVGFGPYAGQLLGDYGAEVIKIESPEGDITRGITPYKNPGMGHFFMNANRNKRCLVLNLKEEKAREACLRLIESADVLVCSVRPAAMESQPHLRRTSRLWTRRPVCASPCLRRHYPGLIWHGRYARRTRWTATVRQCVRMRQNLLSVCGPRNARGSLSSRTLRRGAISRSPDARDHGWL
jgi:hypothetical protein